MSREFISTVKPILALISVIALVHIVLVQYVLPEVYGNSKYWLIYLFLVLLTLGSHFFMVRGFVKDKNSLGKNFMAYMVVKMIGSILFLSPWLFYRNDYSRPIVYQFFIIFFPLLFIETLMLVKLLNKNQ